MGIGERPIVNVLSDQEIDELVATGLNLNGHLCAKVVDIRSLRVKGAYEATCIAFRGGTSRKTYIIDSSRGTAFLP